MPTKRISEYNANRLLDHEFEDGAWLQPHSGDPGEDGLDNVIVGAPRVFVSNWSVAADKAKHNVDLIDFEDMPESVVNHFSKWDAEEGGNFERSTPYLAGSPLVLTDVECSEGDTLRIPAEVLTFRFSNVAV